MTVKNTLECSLIVTSNRPYCSSQWVNRSPYLLTFTDYTLHYITLSKSGSEIIYMWPKFLGQTFYPTDGQTVFLNINSFIHENRLAFDCPWTITTINHCDPTLSCMNPKIYLIDWLIDWTLIFSPGRHFVIESGGTAMYHYQGIDKYHWQPNMDSMCTLPTSLINTSGC